MSKVSSITTAAKRSPPVLVCKKCLGRIGAGKAFRKSLKTELKHQSEARSVKPPRVVMTSCFGICPKGAVVVANGATLQRGEYFLVRDSDSAPEAAELLMSPDRS